MVAQLSQLHQDGRVARAAQIEKAHALHDRALVVNRDTAQKIAQVFVQGSTKVAQESSKVSVAGMVEDTKSYLGLCSVVKDVLAKRHAISHRPNNDNDSSR
jgi:hypothetical protein